MKQKRRSFLVLFLLPVALVAGLAAAITWWSMSTIKQHEQSMYERAEKGLSILGASLALDQEIARLNDQAVDLLVRAASGQLDEAGAYRIHSRLVDGLAELRRRIDDLAPALPGPQADAAIESEAAQLMVREFEQYQASMIMSTDIAAIDPPMARRHIEQARAAYANFARYKHQISSRLAQRARQDNRNELTQAHTLISQVTALSIGGLIAILALMYVAIRALSQRLTNVAQALHTLRGQAATPPPLPLMDQLAGSGQGLLQDMAQAVLAFRSALIERQQAEEQLRKLSQAVEQNPSSIVITNLAGDIEYVNQAFVNATGYSAQEAIGKNPRLLQSGRTPAGSYQEMWAALTAGRLWRGEFTNRRRTGEEYIESALISPMRDAQGNTTHYLGIQEDITPRKQMEQELAMHREHLAHLVDVRTQALQQSEAALRQAQTMLRNVLDTIPVGVFWKDRDLRYLGCNRTFAKDAGVDSPDDLVGKTTVATNWRDQTAAFEANDAEVMKTGNGLLACESEIVFPDGKKRWILTSKIPLRDEPQIIGVLGVYEDITERKTYELEILEARKQADAANRAKSDFLSSMSHELRTPLTAIIGFSQLMRHNTRLPEEFKPQADSIHRAGQHLLELINDLLDMARIEAGKMDIVMQDVALHGVCDQCLELARPLAQKHQVRFINTLDANEERIVLADPIRLKQIVLNLMSNAVKYNRPNGSVTLAVHEAGVNRLRLSVTDTGHGIAPELMAKLFNPFERLGAERSKVEGTGIGLSITKRLLGMMNGQLEVQSEVGVGSTFSVVLQLSERDPHYHAA